MGHLLFKPCYNPVDFRKNINGLAGIVRGISEMQDMKTEIRKELIVIPAQVQVKEHIKHYYVCRSCDIEGTESNIVGAKVPKPV